MPPTDEICAALRKPGRGRVRGVRLAAADMIEQLAADLEVALSRGRLYHAAIAKRRLMRAQVDAAVQLLDRSVLTHDTVRAARELLHAALDADMA